MNHTVSPRIFDSLSIRSDILTYLKFFQHLNNPWRMTQNVTCVRTMKRYLLFVDLIANLDEFFIYIIRPANETNVTGDLVTCTQCHISTELTHSLFYTEITRDDIPRAKKGPFLLFLLLLSCMTFPLRWLDYLLPPFAGSITHNLQHYSWDLTRIWKNATDFSKLRT